MSAGEAIRASPAALCLPCWLLPWKINQAPSAIRPNPVAWFQPSGSFRTHTENPANTTRVMTSRVFLS